MSLKLKDKAIIDSDKLDGKDSAQFASASHSHTLPTASTGGAGIVQLYGGYDSSSTSLAATASAVKAAYDKASHSHPYLPTSGGTLTGKLTTTGAIDASVITTSNKQLLNVASNTVYIGNPTVALNLESVNNPKVKVGSSAHTLYHTGNKPTPAELGVPRMFSYAYSFGGTQTAITTSQFLTMLESLGAFRDYYWIARGSWSYAANNYISDTGLGNIHLAGCTVEVIGNNKNCCTIRIHTPPTSGVAAATSCDFIYVNNGDVYSPGWRRLATNVDLDLLKQSVSSGKNAIASAITAKGISASGSDSHTTLANKISQIKTGGISANTAVNTSCSSWSTGLMPTPNNITNYTSTASFGWSVFVIDYNRNTSNVQVSATDYIVILYDGDTTTKLSPGQSKSVYVGRNRAMIINPSRCQVTITSNDYGVGYIVE